MEDPRQAMEDLLESSGSRFDAFDAGARVLSPDEVISILAPQLSDERIERIDAVLAGRTYQVAAVVEGVINTGNVSAVMRTAEGLGFQPFHVIRGDAPYKHSVRTTQGAQKWLDVTEWEEPVACVQSLQSQGFQVVVTALTDQAIPLDQVDVTRPTAFVFGNEQHGASDQMLECADMACVLPSPGFIQSYNISVAAAMTLHWAHSKRVELLGSSGSLSAEDTTRLRADFYIRSVRRAEDILRKAVGD